ncbi:T9SS type A sorting domain-containing protein, partial [Belliella pelovolcani]|uniref:T9SS type A sorting domain-containing protein n=1 Tax=Belliella pelovolcani TaxID=529505 RepID=UPI0039192C76
TNEKLPLPEGEILEEVITSIDHEIIDSGAFKIYPNPSDDKINIALPRGFNQFQYKILDVTGKVLMEGGSTAVADILELEIRDFKAGLYIFELNDNRQVLRKRFIKK